jgi:hypothetical protein
VPVRSEIEGMGHPVGVGDQLLGAAQCVELALDLYRCPGGDQLWR